MSSNSLNRPYSVSVQLIINPYLEFLMNWKDTYYYNKIEDIKEWKIEMEKIWKNIFFLSWQNDVWVLILILVRYIFSNLKFLIWG